MKKKINGLVEFFSVFVFFLPLFFNELTRVRSEICRDRMRATGGTTAREPARTSTSDRIKPVPHHFFFGFLYFFFHLHYFSFVYPPSPRPLDFWWGGFFFLSFNFTSIRCVLFVSKTRDFDLEAASRNQGKCGTRFYRVFEWVALGFFFSFSCLLPPHLWGFFNVSTYFQHYNYFLQEG